MSDEDAGPQMFVTGSRTVLNALLLRGDDVPDEIQRVQDLIECVDNNAQKIAAALAANRRRGVSLTGADTTAQLLKEQRQFISQIAELYETLSTKSIPVAPMTN